MGTTGYTATAGCWAYRSGLASRPHDACLSKITDHIKVKMGRMQKGQFNIS